MSVKKCLVNSRLFGSVILHHILIMCIRSHHRHLRLHLAALHSVANANRKQAETRQGEKDTDSPILSTRLDTMWLKQLKRIALMTMLMN
ncbi:hypothetical protein DPMN_164790 [Dreissena polymorpha]|uniref:Uncharacterized protein n=1 Tax=Dreissena polymorpha TaxID=45954 RepID=A0A9D4ISN6_DREPO|nr:hypothetical protein DPMN_164790 [Dreissena polymorpha]